MVSQIIVLLGIWACSPIAQIQVLMYFRDLNRQTWALPFSHSGVFDPSTRVGPGPGFELNCKGTQAWMA